MNIRGRGLTYKFSLERSSPPCRRHLLLGGACERVQNPQTPELDQPPPCKESRVGAPPQPNWSQTPKLRCGALRLCKP